MSEDCERIGEFVAAVHAAVPGSALGLLGPGSTVRACFRRSRWWHSVRAVSPAGAGALPMAVMAVRARLERLADGLVERLQRRVELLLALVCEAGFALMQ